jgi:hypothetical protein
MVTYTTATKVANLLQISIGTTTTPTTSQVESIILRQEDYIDYRSNHSWRTTSVGTEYINPQTNYRLGSGVRFKLKHRKIKSITLLEIYDGSNWVDYVATKVEGRNNNYWINYTEGVVYILDRVSFFPDGVRASYTYGDEINYMVEDIATKLSAIDVINTYDKMLNFPDDGSTTRPTHAQRIQSWNDDTEKKFMIITEFTSL